MTVCNDGGISGVCCMFEGRTDERKTPVTVLKETWHMRVSWHCIVNDVGFRSTGRNRVNVVMIACAATSRSAKNTAEASLK